MMYLLLLTLLQAGQQWPWMALDPLNSNILCLWLRVAASYWPAGSDSLLTESYGMWIISRDDLWSLHFILLLYSPWALDRSNFKKNFFILILFYSVLVMSVNIWSLWRNNSVRITSVGILRNLLSIVPSELGTEGSYLFQRYEFLCLYFKEWLLSSSCKAILVKKC